MTNVTWGGVLCSAAEALFLDVKVEERTVPYWYGPVYVARISPLDPKTDWIGRNVCSLYKMAQTPFKDETGYFVAKKSVEEGFPEVQATFFRSLNPYPQLLIDPKVPLKGRLATVFKILHLPTANPNEPIRQMAYRVMEVCGDILTPKSMLEIINQTPEDQLKSWLTISPSKNQAPFIFKLVCGLFAGDKNLYPSLECLVALGAQFASIDTTPIKLLDFLFKQDFPLCDPLKLLVALQVVQNEEKFRPVLDNAKKYLATSQEINNIYAEAFVLALDGTASLPKVRDWWIDSIATCCPNIFQEEAIDVSLREALAARLEIIPSRASNAPQLKRLALDFLDEHPSSRFVVLPDFKENETHLPTWLDKVDTL